MKLKLTVKLTNRAILLAGEDIKSDQYAIGCDLDDLPNDAREQIADRLFDDQYVCEAVVNEAGGMEPKVEYGEPILLCVDGTEVGDLIDALGKDQEEVEAYLAQLAAKKEKPEA